MVKVVCNASPIIGLSKLGLLNILYEMFDVYIPQEVYNEVVLNTTEGVAGKKELQSAIDNEKIKIYEVKDSDLVNKLYGHLHRGEIETVIAARELEFEIVIIDERSARRFAETFFLDTIGVLGILERAKELGRIEKIKPLLDELKANDFRMSNKLYNDILKRANED